MPSSENHGESAAYDLQSAGVVSDDGQMGERGPPPSTRGVVGGASGSLQLGEG